MTPTTRLVECLIEDDRWTEAGLEAFAETAACGTLTAMGLVPEEFEISLLACDDSRIGALNAEFRGLEKPTNVLSWPNEDRSAEAPGERPKLPLPGTAALPKELGDIAVAYETCVTEAETAGISLDSHVQHLIVHGVLHLLGYDHENDQDASLMEHFEIDILASLGLPDPYRNVRASGALDR